MYNDISKLFITAKNSVNPQQFLINMIQNNNEAKNNPLMKNALMMLKNGDNKGLEIMCKNVCNEKGINPNDLLNQLSNILK